MRGTLLGARSLTRRALRARTLRPARALGPLRTRRVRLARTLRPARALLPRHRAARTRADRTARTLALRAAGALRAGRRALTVPRGLSRPLRAA
ncbi:hypothetical protein LB823_22925, partial [Tsukamurella sp. M9C]|uniref:hypothetical protein n=1 Tax=Tsukamurella sp. M9C TaxID=2877520 RepID=UPI001CCC92AB